MPTVLLTLHIEYPGNDLGSTAFVGILGSKFIKRRERLVKVERPAIRDVLGDDRNTSGLARVLLVAETQYEQNIDLLRTHYNHLAI